jgi:hypothetical protein
VGSWNRLSMNGYSHQFAIRRMTASQREVIAPCPLPESVAFHIRIQVLIGLQFQVLASAMAPMSHRGGYSCCLRGVRLVR